MTTERLMIAGVLLLCALPGCAKSEGPKPMPPSVTTERSREGNTITRSDTITVQAKVVAINQKTREVTLEGADGEKKTIKVGPEVKNLPQVHKGDMVNVAYHRAIAATLKKKGSKASAPEAGEALYTAKPGEMPAAVGAQQVKLTATVTNINKDMQEITLKGPKGRSAAVAVQDPSVLDKVKVGDLVDITYTEAIAIAVDKP